MRAQRFQEIEGADDVGVDIGARVLDAVAHAGLGREMDRDLGRGLGHTAGEPRGVLEHQLAGGEFRKLSENLMAPALERLVVIGGDAVDPQHRVPIGEQAPRQMEADEAGGAGDKKAHEVPHLTARVAFCQTCRPNKDNRQ